MDTTLKQLLDDREMLRAQLSMALDEVERLGEIVKQMTEQGIHREEEEGIPSGR